MSGYDENKHATNVNAISNHSYHKRINDTYRIRFTFCFCSEIIFLLSHCAVAIQDWVFFPSSSNYDNCTECVGIRFRPGYVSVTMVKQLLIKLFFEDFTTGRQCSLLSYSYITLY